MIALPIATASPVIHSSYEGVFFTALLLAPGMTDLAENRSEPQANSTLKDKFSEADQARLRELCRRGHRAIAFTREELDPYDLFKRFDHAPHQYATTLAELAENTLHLNAGLEATSK